MKDNSGMDKCFCQPGWRGQFCDLNDCELTCKFGKCVNNVCRCFEGYEGVNCDLESENNDSESSNPKDKNA